MAPQSVSNPSLNSGQAVELSLISPTFNEKENITPLVERVHKALSKYSYELIVVDDNSPDGTSELAKSLSSKYPLKVIVRTSERGLASAVVAGFDQATGEVLGVLDADLQHPPEEIPALLEAIRGGADVAIASRYVEGGNIEGWSTKRAIISKGAKLLATILLPSTREIKDPLAGFFLFKRKVIDGAVLTPTGYKILLEVLVRGNASQIAEVPYTFKERERGKSNLTLGEQLNFLKHLSRLAWFDGDVKRFLKFCVVGASGTFVYLGLLVLFTEIGGLFYALSAALAYEISIFNNFTWNELWTFRDKRASAGSSVLIRLLKFNLVSLIGLGIHEAVLTFFTEVTGLFYILSAIIAIFCALIWNFFANVKWTWRSRQL
jgi:dolichol-phosphate mannosyltransferase